MLQRVWLAHSCVSRTTQHRAWQRTDPASRQCNRSARAPGPAVHPAWCSPLLTCLGCSSRPAARSSRSARSRQRLPAAAMSASQQQQEAPEEPSGELPEEPAELPIELLVHLLGLADQATRSTAALTSSTMATAAARSTAAITLNSRTTEKADSLRRYLAARGQQHVTSLSLNGGYGGAIKPSLGQHLPAGALEALQIQGYEVALAPVLHRSLSKLTRLKLGYGNTLVGAPKALTALTRLKALRDLEVHGGDDAGRHAFPANSLSKLAQLTRVCLSGFKFSAAGSLAGLSRLSGLQHLSLAGCSDEDRANVVSAGALAAMPGLESLTCLVLWGAAKVISATTVPVLGSSAATLQTLRLSHALGVDAVALTGMSALRKVYIGDTFVLRAAPLLAALARMSHLESLVLQPLTPSAALRELHIVGGSLPAGAFTAMFGGKHLPALTELKFNTDVEDTVGTEELAAVAAACPGLKRLVARGSMKTSTDYSVLSSLQHLTDLVASHVSSTGAAGIATLTNLGGLNIMPPHSVDAFDVHGFSRLRRLTMMTVFDDHSAESPMAPYFFSDKAPRGYPPDVWWQISRMLCGHEFGYEFDSNYEY